MGLDGGAGELLELVSEDNEPSGRLVPRSVCHAQGLLHRTVYVLLTRSGGEEVLLQQRHSAKAIHGGCWDVSVAEHCKPQESYENAAARGLCEELRVAMSPQALRQALPPSRRLLECTSSSGARVLDAEFVALYTADAEGVSMEPDGIEVAAVRWVDWPALIREMREQPTAFTPWLAHTLRLLGRLPL